LQEHFTRNVEGQILRVDDSLDKVKPFGDEVLAIVHDKHSAHIELDVVALLLLLKHVERRTLGHKQDRAEIELSIDKRVLVGKVLLPIVGKGLVEGTIILGRDVIGVSGTEGLDLYMSVRARERESEGYTLLSSSVSFLISLTFFFSASFFSASSSTSSIFGLSSSAFSSSSTASSTSVSTSFSTTSWKPGVPDEL
jgi:hypothetical protein